MKLKNETEYANKIFSLVDNIKEAKRRLHEKFGIESEIKDCNTIVIDADVNESNQQEIIDTIYSVCPEDMVSVEFE